MQKYKSNITTTSGAAVRGVPVHVLAEDGSPASIFLDRAGTVQAANPLSTASDGTFYFYAENGRYSLRTTVDGVTITDADVALLWDPAEVLLSGPLAEAVERAEASAAQAEAAVADSGIVDLVASAQNAVVDAKLALAEASGLGQAAQEAEDAAASAVLASQVATDAANLAGDAAQDAILASAATIKAYATHAEASIAAALLPDGADVEVSQDETRAGARTRYKVQAGALVFLVNLDQVRVDLAAATGASLVGFTPEVPGAVQTTVQKKLRQNTSAADFGAVGDGETNDTDKFAAFEAGASGMTVDLLGKTYVVSAIPSANRYTNGFFKVGAVVSAAPYASVTRANGGKVAIGDGALAALPVNYDVGTTGSVIALGKGALGTASQVKKAIAIGPMAQGESPCSRDNIAIGEDALRFVKSRTPDYDQAQLQGTRNIAIGGNAGRFLYEGYNNIAIGRNAGQDLRDIAEATVIGAGAAVGYSPIGLTGKIENWAPNDGPDGFVAIGAQALRRTKTGFNTAVGASAAEYLVAGRGNTVVGSNALDAAEKNSGFNGNQQTTLNVVGTYAHAGNVLTLNVAAHGAVVGDIVGFRLLDGGSNTFQNDIAPAVVVSVIDANAFTVAHPASASASGSAQLYWRVNQVAASKSECNTVIGALAAHLATFASENTAAGYRALADANDAAGVTGNTALGYRALTGWTSPQRMTALGHGALRLKQDGSVATGSGLNCTGVGQNTRVSGDNQVQIGDSATTTYVYGTVQNRSDLRDKADVQDTELGLEFILGLRAVEGCWDLRDDYIQTSEDGKVTLLPKDGSKKRRRKHQWFIAQEVQALCERLGVDFGGLQDHSVNGGCDVLTLGYDEFIPPVVRAIQQIAAKQGDIERRLAALEVKQ